MDSVPEVIVADALDLQAMRALAKRTRVVITAAGPYSQFGYHLVEACAIEGTHYADLSGEFFFQRNIIDSFDAKARASGAMLVIAAGFDSLPFDIGQHLAYRALGNITTPVQISAVVTKAHGYASGGTLASAAEGFNADVPKSWNLDPHLLEPGRQCSVDSDVTGWGLLPRFDPIAGYFGVPHFMAFVNARVIRRSLLLNNHQKVSYAEGNSLYALIDSTGFLAKHLLLGEMTFLPKPGEGPSAAVMLEGSYTATIAAATLDGAHSSRVEVIGQGDPGYAHTSKVIAEVGLCLADTKCHTNRAGVLTSASALKADAIVERLRTATHDNGLPLLKFDVSSTFSSQASKEL